MPFPTLPANVSVMAAGTARTAKKVDNSGQTAPKRGSSEDKLHNMKQNNTQNEMGSFSNNVTTTSSDVPRRSSVYSRASTGLSSTNMGRISEEEGSNTNSSVSSGFSASFLTMDNNVAGDEISGEFRFRRSDMGLQSLGELEKSGEQVAAAAPAPAIPQAMELSQGSKGSARKSFFVSDEEMKGSGATTHSLQTSSLALDADDACNVLRQFSNPLANEKLNPSLNSQEQKLKSVSGDSEEDLSRSSSESSDGFLSWDQSRNSIDFIQAMGEISNQQLQQQQDRIHSPITSPPQQQQQHANPFSQPQKQQSFVPTSSYDAHPPQLKQQSYSAHQPALPTNTLSYNRSGSQETNESMSSNGPTPFRPMLPRELLLQRRIMPLPVLPADASGTAATAARTTAKGSGRGQSVPESGSFKDKTLTTSQKSCGNRDVRSVTPESRTTSS